MKAPSTHQQALEAALQQYLATAQPLLRQQALLHAASHVLNPGMVLAAPQLTASHPLRREALALSDAFEAVTNGMQTPEVMQDLQAVAPDSPLQPWRQLVLALHFFYERLDEAALAHLAQVPASSPLSALARNLEAFLGQPGARLSPAAQALHDVVHAPDPELSALAQQLTDTLEGGEENGFWAALADFLEDCGARDATLARRVALWAWNQLAWQDFDEAPLLDLTAALWGRAEAFRLASLGTWGWDPEGSLLLWARFLIHGLREDVLTPKALAEAHRLALDFLGAVRGLQDQPGAEPPDEWEDAWASLTRGWAMECALRGLEAPLPVRGRPSTNTFVAPATDGQLDLFAS